MPGARESRGLSRAVDAHQRDRAGSIWLQAFSAWQETESRKPGGNLAGNPPAIEFHRDPMKFQGSWAGNQHLSSNLVGILVDVPDRKEAGASSRSPRTVLKAQ